MKYDLKAPCNNCPFRRDGHIALNTARAAEIASMMLCSRGGTFPCHKTVKREEDSDGNEHNRATSDSQHCAGALIFAEKNQTATQMMRIAERLHLYDAQALMANEVAKEMVFDDLDELLDAHALHPANKSERKRRKIKRRRGPVEFEPEEEDQEGYG